MTPAADIQRYSPLKKVNNLHFIINKSPLIAEQLPEAKAREDEKHLCAALCWLTDRKVDRETSTHTQRHHLLLMMVPKK